MTTRIYYTEPYRATFEASVVACDLVGQAHHVRLDQTAFYPTSGGQPFDTGVLGGVRVLDVLDADDGDIVHVVDAPLVPGAVVSGAIDWARRFEHMQQHTGQHVLSAGFDALSAARTESFHLGTASATIDLAKAVTPAEIAAAEEWANAVVWEDRPVSIRFASAEDAAAMPLRKEPARSGPLRLIEIDGCDLSACGGTHVARTGGIGIIAVAGWEKFRAGTRVEFVCGVRALRRFHAWRDSLAATMKFLSVAPEELAAGVERLQAEGRSLQRTARGLQEQLAAHEARALVARGDRVGNRVVVAEAIEGWDAMGLKALASAAVSAEPAAAVALFSAASPATMVVARGLSAGVDANAVLKAMIGKFGGKGGGRPELAQGGGLAGQSPDLLAEARRLLSV